MPEPIVWILADNRAGDVNQCMGVAEALGWGFVRKNIRYNRLSRLPNWLRHKTLLGVDLAQSDPLLPPYADIIISAGRQTAPVASYLRKHHPAAFLVQLMWPGNPSDFFDLIAVPEHDGRQSSAANMMTTIGTPHRVTPAMLQSEAPKWQAVFAPYSTPRIALIVGGTTKYGRFTPEHAALLGAEASALAASMGASMLVTTSRRTEKLAETALQQAITVPYYFYNWESGGENPYFGLLASSDIIITTGDSMSMCSEASATGKPVMIFAPEDITPLKFRRLHQALYDSQNAAPFPGPVPVTLSPLANSAVDVAAEIRKRYQEAAFS
jgi:mitochondrial fission protein ELM1